jgi:hypothetical protein
MKKLKAQRRPNPQTRHKTIACDRGNNSMGAKKVMAKKNLNTRVEIVAAHISIF